MKIAKQFESISPEMKPENGQIEVLAVKGSDFRFVFHSEALRECSCLPSP